MFYVEVFLVVTGNFNIICLSSNSIWQRACLMESPIINAKCSWSNSNLVIKANKPYFQGLPLILKRYLIAWRITIGVTGKFFRSVHIRPAASFKVYSKKIVFHVYFPEEKKGLQLFCYSTISCVHFFLGIKAFWVVSLQFYDNFKHFFLRIKKFWELVLQFNDHFTQGWLQNGFQWRYTQPIRRHVSRKSSTRLY